jgi:dynein heavy chain
MQQAFFSLHHWYVFSPIQLVDYRVEFSKWWVTEFKTIKFPSAGTVFDYLIDPETKKFAPWTEKVTKFILDPEMPLQVGTC